MFKIASRVLVALLCLLLIHSCSKNNDVVTEEPVTPGVTTELPVISITMPSKITTTTASMSGKVDKRGNVSIVNRGFCWSTATNPTIANNKMLAGAVTGSGDFTGEVAGLVANTTYYIKAYAETSAGVVYSNQVEFKTISITIPELTTDSTIIIGVDIAWFGGTITNDGGNTITAKGVCFSTSPNPTIESSKLFYDKDDKNFTCVLEGLKANTTYYLRAFATNAGGTGYGREIKFATIVGGNVRYTLHKSGTPTADQVEAYAKITDAMNMAVYYYNRFTNINKNLNVYYEPSVPTADGSITGSIRFGTGRVYMNPGTAQHEIAHTIGVGQSNKWNQLIVNGIYTGKNANAVHQWITKDNNATILEDGTGHFKPYQFNNPAAAQVTIDYIYHALVMEGMKLDGLPIN